MDRRGIFLGLGFAVLVAASAACSSSGGTGATSPPTPAPSSSSVILGNVGNVACTAAADAVPGTYAGIDTEGTVTGTTYTQNANPDANDFYTNAYTAPTGGTPAPTTAPIILPSPTVAPTAPGATLAIVYFGEYSIPQTVGLTTAATNGCFTLATIPDETVGNNSVQRSRAVGGGVAGSLASSRAVSGASSGGRIILIGTPAPLPSPYYAFGSGIPAFAYPYAVQSNDIVDGNMENFTITNLTRTSGTGTFTVTTQAVGNAFNAAGTVTITGSTAFYYVPSQNVGGFTRHPLHVRRQ